MLCVLLVFSYSIDCEFLFLFYSFSVYIWIVHWGTPTVLSSSIWYCCFFSLSPRMKSSRCTNKLTVTLFIAFMCTICVCVCVFFSNITEELVLQLYSSLLHLCIFSRQFIVKYKIKCCEIDPCDRYNLWSVWTPVKFIWEKFNKSKYINPMCTLWLRESICHTLCVYKSLWLVATVVTS